MSLVIEFNFLNLGEFLVAIVDRSEADKQSKLQEGHFEIQNQSIDRARVDESGERRPDGIQQDNEYF
tara:strand:+ start:125 stop:325 length:201 start_codon:yes stop_codon:yes gene_type:complete